MSLRGVPTGLLCAVILFAKVQAQTTSESGSNAIYLNSRTIQTDSPQRRLFSQQNTFLQSIHPTKGLYLIQWSQPVQPAWKSDLERLGLQVLDYIPENAYLVYGDPSAARAMGTVMAASPQVRWMGALVGPDKIHPDASPGKTTASFAPSGERFYSLQLVYDPVNNPASLALINSIKSGPIFRQGRSADYYNIIVPIPSSAINSLATLPDLISIQPYRLPEMLCERQAIILTGNLAPNGVPLAPGYLSWLATKGFAQAQFDASGLVVDVTDSPIDNGTTNVNHFALYKNGTIAGNSPSRVVYTRLEGTANTGSVTQAQDGHGNLNAHIIAGQVNLDLAPHLDSSGYHYGVGICPYVRVGGSIIFDTSSFTSPNYDNLAARAYRDGARVSCNSWGADNGGLYDVDAQNYDRLVRDAQPVGSAVATAGNQQMTFVFAAGNAGSDASTVGSPGTAKNVITVGAAENVQPFGGADSSGVADLGADNANDVIDFSSRGPCADQRKKPDLMAPGTHVSGGAPQAVKTMAGTGTKLPLFDGSGVSGGVNSYFFPSSGQQFYTASSGTSHSTPAVAGAAALVYQWFINKGWANNALPVSPAMIKAYLMNSARYMTGVSANDTLYSNNQGMGMVNLGMAFDDAPRFLRDQLPADLFTASGQQRSWTNTIASSSRSVRVTVAWTDAPGSTLGNAAKNNLNLTVQNAGLVYKGNWFQGSFSIPGGQEDSRNNVESVFLPAGVTGNVVISVTAKNINSDGVPGNASSIDQDFALVAYNVSEAPVLPVSGPVNDLFRNAQIIDPSGPFSLTGTVSGATPEVGELALAGVKPTRSVWFRWTAPSSGLLSLETTGTTFAHVLGIYTGSQITSLTLLGGKSFPASGTNRLDAVVSNGSTYYIKLDGPIASNTNYRLAGTLLQIAAPSQLRFLILSPSNRMLSPSISWSTVSNANHYQVEILQGTNLLRGISVRAPTTNWNNGPGLPRSNGFSARVRALTNNLASEWITAPATFP